MLVGHQLALADQWSVVRGNNGVACLGSTKHLLQDPTGTQNNTRSMHTVHQLLAHVSVARPTCKAGSGYLIHTITTPFTTQTALGCVGHTFDLVTLFERSHFCFRVTLVWLIDTAAGM